MKPFARQVNQGCTAYTVQPMLNPFTQPEPEFWQAKTFCDAHGEQPADPVPTALRPYFSRLIRVELRRYRSSFSIAAMTRGSVGSV
jgi:hypothetical protein